MTDPQEFSAKKRRDELARNEPTEDDSADAVADESDAAPNTDAATDGPGTETAAAEGPPLTPPVSARPALPDSHDPEALREAEAFRPNRKPLVFAVATNLLLAALALGVPYWRGQKQAQASVGEFGRFAACLFGGKPRSAGGLALPRGETGQFAQNFMRAKSDWPGRCRDSLLAIAPAEAIFLWPSVKQAGADLRAVVALFEHELEDIAELRGDQGSGRVPQRPLLVLAKLRAGLTLLAQAAGTDAALDEDAIDLPPTAALAEPARLPLYAGSSAMLQAWPGQDGIEVIALDGRGISWLRVESGRLERRRIERTSLVRRVLRRDGAMWVLWAMPPKRCAEREDRCARRAMGAARLEQGAERLPDPIWLTAHPAGRTDRVVHIAHQRELDVIALDTPDGDLAVRRFDLETNEALDTAPQDKPQPRGALAHWPLPTRARNALMIDGVVAYITPEIAPQATTEPAPANDAADDAAKEPAATSSDGARAWLWRYASEPPRAPEPLGRLETTESWLASCVAGDVRWLVHGAAEGGQVARVQGEDTPSAAIELAMGLPAELDREDPARDGIMLHCEHDALTVYARDADATLRRARCDQNACAVGDVIANNVAGFSATRTSTGEVVAVTGLTRTGIAVYRLDAQGVAAAPPVAPAPCWDPTGGMCGQPTLVVAGKRLLLAARDGSDLLALESSDGGTNWRRMGGLEIGAAVRTDAHSVMQQHRIRKGLD